MDKLNKEFKKYKLMFIYKEHINLNGYYDKKNDEIQIFYSNKDSFNEMVHKIQHKHSNKYFEKIVNQINNNEKKLVQLFNTNTSQPMKEWNTLRLKNKKYIMIIFIIQYMKKWLMLIKKLKTAPQKI